MNIKLGGILAAALIAIAGSANAAITINLDGGGVNTPGATTINGLNVGNIWTYTSGSITLTAQGWTYDRDYDPDQLLSSYLGAYSGNGLGVSSPKVDTNGGWNGNGIGGAQEGGSPQHTVDNNADGRVDFVLLKFSKAVDLTSVYFNVFDANSDGPADSDAVAYYKNGATAPTNGGNAQTYLGQFATIALPGDNNSGSRSVAGVTYADTWLIAAANGTSTNDAFKIKKLSYDVQPPGVPEPATWLCMIVGFGGAGAMIRRRRRMVSIAG